MSKRLLVPLIMLLSFMLPASYASGDYALPNGKIAGNTDTLKMLGQEVPMLGHEAPKITPVEPREDTPPEIPSEDIEIAEPEPFPAESEDVEPFDAVLSEDLTVSDDIVPDEPRDIITSDDVKAKSQDTEYTETITPEPETPAKAPAIKADEFMRMCSGASSEMIRNAVENRNADVNARDYYDVTPLMYAAEKNSDPKVINILVEHGAKTDAKDKDGKTPLMYAAKSNPVPEIISALASNGANTNARDNNRMTALMYAARNNSAKVAKALIDAGAEELADKRGWTPLFWAARYTRDPEVIGVLLDAGHDPQARAHDMTTPIDHANRNPSLMNTKEFLRLEEESR